MATIENYNIIVQDTVENYNITIQDTIEDYNISINEDSDDVSILITETVTNTNIVIDEIGIKGDTGISNYQIAVNNGFTGDEMQWLESQKNIDGGIIF